jgi:hypothetical protein
MLTTSLQGMYEHGDKITKEDIYIITGVTDR